MTIPAGAKVYFIDEYAALKLRATPSYFERFIDRQTDVPSLDTNDVAEALSGPLLFERFLPRKNNTVLDVNDFRTKFIAKATVATIMLDASISVEEGFIPFDTIRHAKLFYRKIAIKEAVKKVDEQFALVPANASHDEAFAILSAAVLPLIESAKEYLKSLETPPQDEHYFLTWESANSTLSGYDVVYSSYLKDALRVGGMY